MIDELRTVKIISIATAALLAVAVALLLTSWRSKAQIQIALKKERLRSEALLSEKLSIEKRVDVAKVSLLAAEDSIRVLAKRIALHAGAKGNRAAFLSVVYRLYVARTEELDFEKQLSNAYWDRRKLLEQNAQVLDSL